jgi:hypothetical protein
MSDWEIVRTVGTEEEATLIVGFLESAGIAARVESLRFHQEPVNFGKLGEVRVLVPADSVVSATELLDASDLAAGDGEGGAASSDSD